MKKFKLKKKMTFTTPNGFIEGKIDDRLTIERHSVKVGGRKILAPNNILDFITKKTDTFEEETCFSVEGLVMSGQDITFTVNSLPSVDEETFKQIFEDLINRL